jgi:hypothetical protein
VCLAQVAEQRNARRRLRLEQRERERERSLEVARASVVVARQCGRSLWGGRRAATRIARERDELDVLVAARRERPLDVRARSLQRGIVDRVRDVDDEHRRAAAGRLRGRRASQRRRQRAQQQAAQRRREPLAQRRERGE